MWGTSLKGEWDMGDGYSLTSITAYRNLTSRSNADQDGEPKLDTRSTPASTRRSAASARKCA